MARTSGKDEEAVGRDGVGAGKGQSKRQNRVRAGNK